MKKNWTGELLETHVFSRDAIEHLHRYSIVNKYISNKIVLDIACGEGYGSNLMALTAKRVYGVYIDKEVINVATNKYTKNNLSYQVGSVTEIPFEDNSIDVIVSFETLEHHDKHQEMMIEIKRVLKKEGLLFLSTPDKLYYTDKANFKNEFHVKELYKVDFLKLVNQYFSQTQFFTQKYLLSVSIIQDESDYNGLNIFSGNYNDIQQKNIEPLFLIAIASDVNYNLQIASIFEGSPIIKKQVSSEINKSNSFKLGSFLLFPIKKIKRLIK
ncbi:class I SAM-dependent methyltransferase [Flavobacterium sp. LB2R40]|uniref:class I SAM-dependent methyltransferase n=1 Tax=Flavobacterium sp. LB2R40 TaxID=3401722 RepID=UPI003AABC9A2